MAPLPIEVLRAALLTPAGLEILLRLAGRVAQVRHVDPVGFFQGLFDPSKLEANAAALVSAELDVLLVQQDVELLKLEATTADAVKVSKTIAELPARD